MSELAAGQIIETFRITRRIAEGAMGEVYLAVDEQLGRRVALKFIKSGMLDARALERFRDEARTTARFNHPHIVTVYAAGVFRGRAWLALEYLDGQTLRERLDEGPLSSMEAMRVARAIAAALTEAHAHEVVHADLKPENVLIPRDGRVRVVDFGLARLIGGESSTGSGTPAYMAPERWAGKPPQPSIDVWALGVLLHEVLEGRRPLDEAGVARLAYTPEPVVLGPRVTSSTCSSLVADCLSLDPHGRPSAADLVARLDLLLAGRETGPEVRSPFRGLEAFTEIDAGDLQGRTEELSATLERLRTDAMVPIVGPSGVGKSSFVFAGVVPRLKESGTWRVLSMRPGRNPWASLASALGCDATALAQHPVGLVNELRRLSGRASRVLLVIDQFEELVTLASESARTSLLSALALAASPEEPWRILVTLRSDFLGEFATEPALTASLESVQVLRPLGRAALEAAVRAPLERVGFEVDDPSLPARIARELEGQPAALPLLQFVCQALWDRRDTQYSLVLHREYEAMGGATGALASHAQRLVSELTPAERRLTRALLLRLVNADGTRRPRTRTELLDGQPEAGMQLDRLLNQRLLVSDRPSDDTEPLIELAHESLVSAWPQLSRWLTETQESRALAQDLEQAAQLWDRRGRRVEETWVDEALADVLRRVEQWNTSLTDTPRAFLEAGRHRQAQLAQRRRAVQLGAFATITLVALTAGGAAFAFREKQLEALAQQDQIRLAAGDVGRFELVLEPFDWDPVQLEARPVSATAMPQLTWVVHAPSKTNSNEVGPPLATERVHRMGTSVDADGRLHEVVEMGSGPVVFEFTGRGACGSSWLFVKQLPGYADRRDPPTQIKIPVPTCGTTRADQVRLVADGGQPFFIDRTEVTDELWHTYERLGPLTGDRRLPLTSYFATLGTRALPLVGVDAITADHLCAFLGRRVPSSAEWTVASLGHPQKTGARVDAGCVANFDEQPDGFERLAPVSACAGDVTREGVVDLLGNVSEWVSDSSPDGFREYRGSNWSYPSDAPPSRIGYVNARPPETRDYSMGVRCASE